MISVPGRRPVTGIWRSASGRKPDESRLRDPQRPDVSGGPPRNGLLMARECGTFCPRDLLAIIANKWVK